MFPDKIFVTGINTDVGKTIVSAVLCHQFGYHYWKPIQSGTIDGCDSDTIKNLVPGVIKYPESYSLSAPLSPHAAAIIDQVELNLDSIVFPESNKILVEGAGGIIVPINTKHTIADLIIKFNLPIILVIRNYLGCINHTMLSIEYLKKKEINIAGIVFNGNFPESTITWLLNHLSQYDCYHLHEITSSNIKDSSIMPLY